MTIPVKFLGGAVLSTLALGFGLASCAVDPGESLEACMEAPTTLTTSAAGCADGQREGFVNLSQYPNIAGCSGAWSIRGIHGANPGTAPACPGLQTNDTTTPACGRQAGDDGANPSGNGCNVADLCAPGWRVCDSAFDVANSSPTGCTNATQPNDPPLFFASRQSSNGCAVCAIGSSTGPQCDSVACVAGCLQTDRLSNDVFGCGNFGAGLSGCGPLNSFSNNMCASLAGSPWSCNAPTSADDSGFCEAYTVNKSNTSHGGVLCCRDPNSPPDCSNAAASPASLWPPNHALAPVQVAGVTDPDPGDTVTVTITSVRQDEPLNTVGDGNTSPDATGVGTGQAQVRAERTGNKHVPGDGRVYHIGFTATDAAGAQCTGTVTVCVPHDQGQGSACVDGGPLYDSTSP